MIRKTSNLNSQILSILMVLIIGVLVGCAGKKLKEEPQKGLILKYNMPKKQVLKYQTLSQFTQNLEIMGNTMEVKMGREYEFSVKTKEFKDNIFQLSITIDSMDINVVTPQEEFSPELDNVIGKSFDMTLSPLGKELDLSGAESIYWELPGEKHSVVSDYQTVFPDLPDKPVEVGDTWTSQSVISEKSGNNESQINLENLNTLTGFETIDGFECVKITSEFTGIMDGKGEQEGVKLNSSGEIKGTDIWYFAHKEGIFVKIITEGIGKGTITAVGPQKMKIPMTREFKTEVKLIK